MKERVVMIMAEVKTDLKLKDIRDIVKDNLESFGEVRQVQLNVIKEKK